jgi:gluconokinase
MSISPIDEVSNFFQPASNLVSGMNEKSPAVVLSLDVGTSGVRAVLFDDAGNELEQAQTQSQRESSFGDFAELDADAIVTDVVKTIDELMLKAPDCFPQYLAISAFWHSLVGADADENATTPLLTWADTRGAGFVRQLRSEFDESEWHARTGCRFHPSYWPAKLLWLRNEFPERVAQTKLWLGFAEFLCLKLFGTPAASISLASATGLFNQHTNDWDWQSIDALKIARQTLPPIVIEPGTRFKAEFRNRWPTLSEAVLTVIIGDGAANNIGGGCTTNARVALMVGTSGAMRTIFAGEPAQPLSLSLWSYRVDERRVVTGGALSDGGGLYRWLTRSLLIDDLGSIESQLARLEAVSHGLTILPCWSGERSTGWLPDARGAILGLTQRTTTIDIVRAALEAIAYRFALISKALEQAAPGATIVATGNALRASPVWAQIIADVLGRNLVIGGSAEASARGAALLALEVVGKIGAIEDLSAVPEQVFEPDMSRHALYAAGLTRQEEIYRRLMEDVN